MQNVKYLLVLISTLFVLSSFSQSDSPNCKQDSLYNIINLSISKETEGNLIFWSTQNESISDYFIIYKSDGEWGWDKVTIIGSTYNPNDTCEYEYLDRSPYNGDNYYKIRQFDTDGTCTDSEEIFVSNARLVYFWINDEGQIQRLNSVYGIRIYDVLGNQVASGEPSEGAEVSHLDSGVYTVKLSNSFITKFHIKYICSIFELNHAP